MTTLHRLLLLEDDPADLARLVSLLRPRDEDAAPAPSGEASGGFEMTCTSTLAEARQALHADTFDCVLADLHVPDGSGLELLGEVDSVDTPPLVLMTGRGQEAQGLDALRAGAQDYLSKQHLDGGALRRSVHYAIERHRIHHALEAARRDLDRLASLDPLTNTLNRRGLSEHMRLEWQRAPGQPMSMLLLDCDSFKQINDRFGHATGDRALRLIARTLHEQVRDRDLVARVGGDEFVVVLPRTPLEAAAQVARRICRALRLTPLEHGEEDTPHVTVSVGVTRLSEHMTASSELLAMAQGALRQAKKQGKNQVVVHGLPGTDADALDHELVQLQQIAADPGLLTPLAQTIRDAHTDQITGVELLIRGPEGPLRSPTHLFDAALAHHLLTPIDLSCLRASVMAARKVPLPWMVHVNIMPSTLLNTPPEELLELLRLSERPLELCCLEINEQQSLYDSAALLEPLRALRAAGVHLAADDVGFGKSRLEPLILLEPDLIKLDRRVALEARRTPRSLRRILKVCAALGVETVVEGIEDEELRACAQSMGAARLQGFLYETPRPLEHILPGAR